MKNNDSTSTDDLVGRRILVIVSGGIAAYKVVEVIRRLKKRGAEVKVIMTKSATRFIQATTFSTISGHPVGLEMFNESGLLNVDHLSLPHWAEVILIAPATANLLAKMTAGLADDLASTALLAAKCPIIIAPAMNSAMFEHPATQRNLEILHKRGIHQVGPEFGEMAAVGEEAGLGRLSEPDQLLRAIVRLFSQQDFAGKKVVVTAGRTEESIDAVRILTNRSSGRMGVALAESARDRGALVILIHGPMEVSPPDGVQTYKIGSALELLEAVRCEAPGADYIFYAAAVADWRPKTTYSGKLKKERDTKPPILKLVENPDIAKETSPLCAGVKIGFALEEKVDYSLAREKLQSKRLNAMVLNTTDAIGAEVEAVVWLDDRQQEREHPLAEKRVLADWLLDQALAYKP